MANNTEPDFATLAAELRDEAEDFKPKRERYWEAADAIDTLQARIVKLVKERERQEGFANAFESLSDNLKTDIARLQADNAALLGERDELRQLNSELQIDFVAENKQLREALQHYAETGWDWDIARAALKENHGK